MLKTSNQSLASEYIEIGLLLDVDALLLTQHVVSLMPLVEMLSCEVTVLSLRLC